MQAVFNSNPEIYDPGNPLWGLKSSGNWVYRFIQTASKNSEDIKGMCFVVDYGGVVSLQSAYINTTRPSTRDPLQSSYSFFFLLLLLGGGRKVACPPSCITASGTARQARKTPSVSFAQLATYVHYSNVRPTLHTPSLIPPYIILTFHTRRTMHDNIYTQVHLTRLWCSTGLGMSDWPFDMQHTGKQQTEQQYSNDTQAVMGRGWMDTKRAEYKRDHT